MKKTGLILPIVLLILTARLRAQGIDGCADSPENPTLVLGLIVGAVSVGYSRLRYRRRSHNKSGD